MLRLRGETFQQMCTIVRNCSLLFPTPFMATPLEVLRRKQVTNTPSWLKASPTLNKRPPCHQP
eukprot:6133746-Amphidinium_carterae.2